MMVKPPTFDGYSDQYTLDCERGLVTLPRGMGPWKDSVYLVGGLTPRYLVSAWPSVVPAHAGNLDVDMGIDLQILTNTESCQTLEKNLRRMGFGRAENEQGVKHSCRLNTRTELGALMVLELLADAPQMAGGRVQPLPTDGTISALDIPHSWNFIELDQVAEFRAELLGENGTATELVAHAEIVSFTCLKALAFDQRFERKDAHDLIYCIEYAPEGLDAVVAPFGRALSGKHAAVTRGALNVIRRRFAGDEPTDGYRKDGPNSVGKFELDKGQDPKQREARVLRQRLASDLADRLLAGIG